jgi:hypothetical protein
MYLKSHSFASKNKTASISIWKKLQGSTITANGLHFNSLIACTNVIVTKKYTNGGDVIGPQRVFYTPLIRTGVWIK